jgi:large subunit ribosomal protein L2
MALKTYKPVTSSMRGLVLVDRSDLHKGGPIKALTEGLTKSGDRNNHGRLTMRHIGGGHKRRYRKIDFKRTKFDVVGTVQRLEYDPNRTAFIALIKYEDGELAYILAPQRLKAGDQVVSSEQADIKPGNAMPLKNIPVGTIIHNIEMKTGKGAQIARSAELRLVRGECMASVGAVSNPDNQNIKLGKAGRKRWMGVRPTVRGVVMNPVDHPHGGGEGKTSGGRHPVTPWGKPTKGKKTRSNKRTDGLIMRSRHLAKKKRK